MPTVGSHSNIAKVVRKDSLEVAGMQGIWSGLGGTSSATLLLWDPNSDAYLGR